MLTPLKIDSVYHCDLISRYLFYRQWGQFNVQMLVGSILSVEN